MSKSARTTKANVTYISSYKKRTNIKPYTKTDDDWYNILRANCPDKKISFKAARLASKLHLELHKNNNNPVYKDNYWFSKITLVTSSKQNKRIRDELKHIFNFISYKKVIDKGKCLRDVYAISYTEDAFDILNFKDVKNNKKNSLKTNINESLNKDKNVLIYGQKCPSSTPLYIINNNTVINKEIEKDNNISFSISNNKKLKIKSFEESKNAPSAFSSPAELAQDASKVPKAQSIPANNNEIYEKATMDEKAPLTAIDRKMLLSKALLSAFGKEDADLLQDDCEFIELEVDKVKITIGSRKSLNDLEKEKIRKSLKSVYGEEVRIVTGKKETQSESVTNCSRLTQSQDVTNCDKPSRLPTPELLANVRSNNSEWFTFRSNLIRVLSNRHEEKTAQHIVKNWFDRLGVSELSGHSRLVLIADPFYIHWIENNYDHVVEEAVCLGNFIVELHYKGNKERPRIYSKELIKRGKK